MDVSLVKKGSQVLSLTLLSLCMSVGSSGFALAHSDVSYTSLKHHPGISVNPKTVKLNTNGTGAFVIHGEDLERMAPYTITSADLGTAMCPLTFPTPYSLTSGNTVTTDLEGDFVGTFNVGIVGTSSSTTTPGTASLSTALGVTTITAPFGGANIVIPAALLNSGGSINIPNPFGGAGSTTATITVSGGNAIVTIPNPAGGSATITVPLPPAAGPVNVNTTNTTVVSTPGAPCVPATYNLNVRQLVTNENHNVPVKITV